VRALFRERLRERLRRGDLPWLARHALRYAAVRLAPRLGRPLAGPILGTLVTNLSCNLRCRMCDLPLRVRAYASEGLAPLDTDETLEVIDDFARLGTLGLGFTGGEPLLRRDIFDLLAHSKRRGMITHLNTNGTGLAAPEAVRLVDLAVDSVNLSLDGATPATHDEIRGCPGNFEAVVTAIATLRRARTDARRRTPRIKIVCVLGPPNLDEAEGLVHLRREIGADCVDFIPMHDFDRPGSERGEPILSPPRGASLERARAVAHRLAELRRTEPVENSAAHLSLLPRALAGEPSPLVCRAGYHSLVVDPYGRIFPCVPWSNRDRAVGNVRETPLREIWGSQAFAAHRTRVEACRDCYLNCHTELNLLFNPRRVLRGSPSSRSGNA